MVGVLVKGAIGLDALARLVRGLKDGDHVAQVIEDEGLTICLARQAEKFHALVETEPYFVGDGKRDVVHIEIAARMARAQERMEARMQGCNLLDDVGVGPRIVFEGTDTAAAIELARRHAQKRIQLKHVERARDDVHFAVGIFAHEPLELHLRATLCDAAVRKWRDPEGHILIAAFRYQLLVARLKDVQVNGLAGKGDELQRK